MWCGSKENQMHSYITLSSSISLVYNRLAVAVYVQGLSKYSCNSSFHKPTNGIYLIPSIRTSSLYNSTHPTSESVICCCNTSLTTSAELHHIIIVDTYAYLYKILVFVMPVVVQLFHFMAGSFTPLCLYQQYA